MILRNAVKETEPELVDFDAVTQEFISTLTQTDNPIFEAFYLAFCVDIGILKFVGMGNWALGWVGIPVLLRLN